MGRSLTKTKCFTIPQWDLNAMFELYEQYDRAEWVQKACRAVILRSEGITYKVLKEKYDTDPTSAAKAVEAYLQDGIAGIRDQLDRIKKYKADVDQRNQQKKAYKKVLKESYGVELLEPNMRHYMLDGTVILSSDKLYYAEIQSTKELLAQERDVSVDRIVVVET